MTSYILHELYCILCKYHKNQKGYCSLFMKYIWCKLDIYIFIPCLKGNKSYKRSILQSTKSVRLFKRNSANSLYNSSLSFYRNNIDYHLRIITGSTFMCGSIIRGKVAVKIYVHPSTRTVMEPHVENVIVIANLRRRMSLRWVRN